MSGSKSQQHARAQHNLPYVPRVSMHGTNHGLKTFYEHNHHTADPTLGVRSHGPEQVARNNANIAAQARSLRHSPTDIGLKSPYRPKTWDAIHADIRQSCHTEQQRPEAALILGRSWQDEILNHNQTKIILQMESQRRKAAELIAWDASRARVDCARALAEKTKGYMTHNMCREHLAREENRRTKLEEELAQARAELVRIKVYISIVRRRWHY